MELSIQEYCRLVIDFFQMKPTNDPTLKNFQLADSSSRCQFVSVSMKKWANKYFKMILSLDYIF